jgi:trypsin
MAKNLMIVVFVFIVLGIGVACDESVTEDIEPSYSRGIVNGELEEGFPSTVSLGGNFGSGPSSMCTGNLVTPRVIISAAHCGDGIPLILIQTLGSAFFGSDITSPDKSIGFKNMTVHPDYEELVSEVGGDPGQFDLSVFVLSKDAEVEPTWFRREAVLLDAVGSEVTSVGFGITSSAGEGSGTKRSAVLVIDDVDENFLLSNVNTNPNAANICSGDSGGPQFFNEDGFWVQAAVHSWGDTQCLYSSGSTRTDIAAEWILDQIEKVHGSRDVCEINGWYGNGICEPYCADLDPDCADPVEDAGDEGDAGDEDDAGVEDDNDAGPPFPVDSGVDGGTSDLDSAGCGCTLVASPSSPGAAPVLLGLVAIFL